MNRYYDIQNQGGKKHWTNEEKPQSCFEQVPEAVLPEVIHRRIRLLTLAVDTEWLGYLCGHRGVNGEFVVTELVIPEQHATGASVDNLELIKRGDILGTVHSHPGHSKPSASGTDQEYIMGNHDLTLIVSKNGVYTAYARLRAKCGLTMVEEIGVVMNVPEGDTNWVKQAREKVKKHVFQPGFPLVQPGFPGGVLRGKEELSDGFNF